MNAALLVAALATPLLGAVAALLVPGDRRSRSPRPPGAGRRGRRRSRRSAEPGETDREAESPVAPPQHPPPGLDPAADPRGGAGARRVVQVAALAAAGLWTAVTLVGEASVGPATAVGAVGPAGAGASLLLAACQRPVRRLPASAGAVALFLLSGGLALAAGAGTAVLAVSGLAAGALVIALAERNHAGVAVIGVALAGLAAVAGGLVRLAAETGAFVLPAAGELGLAPGLLLTLGATAVVVAAGLQARRAGALLLPVGLAIGVPVAGALGPAGDGVAVALALMATAAAATWAVRSWVGAAGVPLLVVALGLGALAAAAVPASGIPGTVGAAAGAGAGVPAGWLLAGAAVVVAVTLVPVAGLAAVPGVAALLVVLVADPEPARLLVGALAIATATAATVAVRRRPVHGDAGADGEEATKQRGLPPAVAGAPALVAGAWLLLAPQSWSWAGGVALDGWGETMAIAGAGGLLGAVAAAASGRVAVPVLPQLAAADHAPDLPPGTSGSAAGRRFTLVAGVGLGLALVALVASSPGVT